MNEHRRWTQTHITELRERVQIGGALADIASALGRTPDEVTTMVRRLRLRLTSGPAG
jgi:hypothetical protein